MIVNVETEVELILRENKEARNDDNILYECYLRQHGLTDEYSVLAFFKYNEQYKQAFHIAELETVGRCRRKVQEKYPELKADAEVLEKRFEKQMSFMDYAHGRGKQ